MDNSRITKNKTAREEGEFRYAAPYLIATPSAKIKKEKARGSGSGSGSLGSLLNVLMPKPQRYHESDIYNACLQNHHEELQSISADKTRCQCQQQVAPLTWLECTNIESASTFLS